MVAHCDIVIYNKEYVFGLSPGFQNRAPKTFGIPQADSDKSVVCQINEVTFPPTS